MTDAHEENRQLWDAWSEQFQAAWAADTDEDERPPAPYPLTPDQPFEPDPPASLPPIEGAAFVELGCGGGQATVGALREGAGTATGVDFSGEQLGYADRLAAAYAVDARFVAGDVTALPLASDAVDIAYSGWVFQMVEDLSAGLREARRVLREDGTFVLDLPHTFYELFDPESRTLRQSYHGEPRRRQAISDEYEPDMIVFDRQLSTVYNALVAANFTVDRVDEPGSDDPDDYRDGALSSTQPELMAQVPRSLRFWARA